MHNRYAVPLVFAACVVAVPWKRAASQAERAPEPAAVEESPRRHKLALLQATSWVPQGRDPETGAKQTVLAPTYGIAYEYWLTDRFALGTYDDVEFINISVEGEDGELLRRENVVVLSGVLVWEPRRPWTVAVGSGAEIDNHETLWIGRIGAEYAFELPNAWELAVSAGYVNKDVYDAVSLGLTVGRRFGPRLRGADRRERHAARDTAR
jgi:hypothetical protein